MKGYIVGCGSRVVVWNHDIFGLTNPASNRRRSKEWADYLAEEGGFTVLIPDWFRGNNMPGPFPTPDWLRPLTNWTKIEADWKEVVLPFLEGRQSEPLSIGLIGSRVKRYGGKCVHHGRNCFLEPRTYKIEVKTATPVKVY